MSDVSTQFGFHLDVGRLENGGKFDSIAGDVRVGETVRIELETIKTEDFR